MLRSYQQPAAHMLHKRVAQLECDSSDNVRPSCCYSSSSSSSPGCCMFDDDPATIASPSKFLSKQRSSSVVTSMMDIGGGEKQFFAVPQIQCSIILALSFITVYSLRT